MNILTWNVGLDGGATAWYLHMLKNRMNENNIDIVCLQEVLVNCLREKHNLPLCEPNLKKVFNKDYYIFVTPRGNNAMVTMIKRDICNNTPTMNDGYMVSGFSFKFAQQIKFEVKETREDVTLWNLHLKAGSSSADITIRSNQISALSIKDGDIFAGDLNTERPTAELKLNGFTGGGKTIHHVGGGGFTSKKFDYIGRQGSGSGSGSLKNVVLHLKPNTPPSGSNYHDPVTAKA